MADVLPNSVKLEAEGKTIELAVGQKMRREDEGAWKLSGSAAASGSDSTVAAVTAEESSESDSGSDNDVLKKLLQKREEELNK